MGNTFFKRFWQSLKYEGIYLHGLSTGSQSREVIGTWICRYKDKGPTPR